MARAPRAFSFGELLDGAFTLYRRNFAVLATCSGVSTSR